MVSKDACGLIDLDNQNKLQKVNCVTLLCGTVWTEAILDLFGHEPSTKYIPAPKSPIIMYLKRAAMGHGKICQIGRM